MDKNRITIKFGVDIEAGASMLLAMDNVHSSTPYILGTYYYFALAGA